MEKQITLTAETFKALAGEKRVQILKALAQRRKTQSELAQKLELSAPTIAEHLSLLEKAGLVHAADEGRKWKYFTLTEKGKEILNPGETRILVLLATSTVAFLAMAGFLLSRFVGFANQAPIFGAARDSGVAIQPLLNQGASKAAQGASETASQGALQVLSQLPGFSLSELSILVLITISFGVLLGYYLHSRSRGSAL